MKQAGIKPKRVGIALLSALIVCGMSLPAAAGYKETVVNNGGSISGRAVYKGTVPPPRPFGLIVYPDREICVRISDGLGRRMLRDFTVAEDGGFQNVVVVVEDVTEGKPFDFKGPRIAVRDCEFRPFMSVVRDRHPITFQNADPVVHDIQTYSIQDNKRGDRIFDRVVLSNGVLKEEIHLPKGQKVVWMQCGKHSFMQTWAYAVENPYFAITAENGTYTISDLPPGRYRVTAWHPFMKLREEIIEVKAGDATVLNFEFGKLESTPARD